MEIDGWWFSHSHTLPHGDGREIKIGATHEVAGKIIPCRNGLHMSVRAMDAINYAPGPIVWRVRLSGIIVAHDDDKHVGSRRTYLAGGIDASDTLRHFARLCALDVIDKWPAPAIVRKYLRTGNENLRVAAWEAARDAAWGAARDAAREAARDAAWEAAKGAAWGAAWEAARGAARGAARDAQNRRLETLLNKTLGE